MANQPTNAIEVFYSYSHKDGKLRDLLDEHLTMLKRQGILIEWYDREVSAGREWEGEIDQHLESANIILLLVSPSFLASHYCYDIEVKRAIERHTAGQARVIPIILRPCDWTTAPFGKLQALPNNAKPIARWANRDEAFLNVAKNIRSVAMELISNFQQRDISSSVPRQATNESFTSEREREEKALEILRGILRGLQQLEQEELIGESLKQKYEERAMDEWFRHMAKGDLNE